jgi:hypothetical protein
MPIRMANVRYPGDEAERLSPMKLDETVSAIVTGRASGLDGAIRMAAK